VKKLAVTLPALAVLLAAAPAQAAEVATATSTQATGMKYTGTSAADNPRVTLADTTYTIDDTAPILAGPGCAQVAGDRTRVTCVAFKDGVKLMKFTMQMRDGDDSVVNASIAPMHANGSGGDDTLDGNLKADDSLQGNLDNDLLRDAGGTNQLDGGSGDDQLMGGVSTDKLVAGSGNDFLDGGGSDDQLDGGADADTIDGGPSGISPGERHDRVIYNGVAPVTVDLNKSGPVQGAAGEGDTIRDVEDISGGRGNDMLIGNAENNFIFGDDGNDTLLGENGLDVLTGGAGADGLSASPSDGLFGILPDGFADILDCSGPGEPVNPGDFAFRELADGDLVNKCAVVFDA
jgi:serralysin